MNGVVIINSKIKKWLNKIINSELFPIVIGFMLFFKVAIFYKLTICRNEMCSFLCITNQLKNFIPDYY